MNQTIQAKTREKKPISQAAITLLLCFCQYIPAGICLGWAYAKSGTIWCPVLIHMTVNQIGMLFMR